jgi:hypothetical protein
MISTSKQLLLCLRDDIKSISDFIENNSEILSKKKNESLSEISLGYIFFYDKNKFSYLDLISKSEKFIWIKDMLQSFYNTLIIEEDNNILYDNLNQLFSIYYNSIKENFSEFISSLEQKKSTEKNDLFSLLITFLSFLNGNKKYLNVVLNIGKNGLISKLKLCYEEKMQKSLWNIITDYCKMQKVPILYSNDTIINRVLLNIELDELKCFIDMCSAKESYKKLIHTLFCCFKNAKDLRDDRPEKIRIFIEDIFALLNICLRKIKFSDESVLLDVYNAIYNKSFEYASKDFNETYIDFVIHYVTKYELSSEDFFHLFLNGLLEGNFRATFTNLHLKEFDDNINETKTIQLLIHKMIKKRKKNKTKTKAVNSNNKSAGEIKKEVNSEISDTKKEEKESQTKKEIIEKEQKLEGNLTENKIEYSPKKLSEKIELEKNEINTITPKNEEKSPKKEINLKLENEIILLKEQNKLLSTQVDELTTQVDKLTTQVNDLKMHNKDLNNKLEDLTEQYKNIYEENSSLSDDNANKNIQIKKLSQDIKEINKKLEIISFRDLSKKLLDNMIQFVQKRNKYIFQGISKRKEKIKILNNNYEYKEFEFMRKPISEIAEKYYNSNILSHVPKIVSIVNGTPFGLLKDPVGEISKRFYQIIIDSKSNNVFNFIQEKLNIKVEIRNLYKMI